MLQIVSAKTGWSHPEGFPQGYGVPTIADLFKRTGDILNELGRANHTNIYFTVAHHSGIGGQRPSRTNATFEQQTVLPFDIDYVDQARLNEYLLPVSELLKCEKENLVLVSSGYGLQVYAHLKNPIRSAKYMKETKLAYNELCHRLQEALDLKKLPGKVDPVIWDPARIMRMPGTLNEKPGRTPAEARLLQYSDAALDIDIELLSDLSRIREQNILPEQLRRRYPKPDLSEMVKECHFVRWAIEKTEEVHEPQAFDLFSLLHAQSPTSKVELKGKEWSARELAEDIFARATASASLARTDFDVKWESSARYGARKCSTVAANWSEGCVTCPHNGLIPTPLALKSIEHIESKELGYWVVNEKGGYSHPHYPDLCKVYREESSYATTSEGRLFNFDGKKYEESSELSLKAWLDRTVNPSDPLRDRHCSEFVRMALRKGSLSRPQEDHLFIRSLHGKLNCQNGMLNMLTGELLPHTPDCGFQYVLPYDYLPDESSPFFLEWLNTIMLGRRELVEAVLDMMAYVLWPAYNDHVFAFFIGIGMNGKSTLLKIIQRMIGKENYSAVSIQQLGSNRFAPSQLEGKLANISSESSGYEMTLEEMNVIKNLSAGEEMMAERKGLQGFLLHNTAKLIFSANKAPRFKEDGLAIQRRMLAIPFDYVIEKSDTRVEERLFAEIPKIVSLLVRRIQENVKLNDGFFRVSRGGVVAQKTQERLLMGDDSVIEWSKEEIDAKEEYSEDACIPVTESFARYTQWCRSNNFMPQNRMHFSRRMYRFVLPPNIDAAKNMIRVGEKTQRVFKRTKWKEREL